MNIKPTDNQLFKGISTNPLPRLTEDKKRELEYIKKKCEMEQLKDARLHK